MAVHLIWERADGEVIKGLKDCATPSADTKELVDSDLNHGVATPGNSTAPQIVAIRTFSWQTNGDPNNPITGAGLYLDQYYSQGPTYEADTGKTYCGGASTTTFGDYSDAGGSRTASSDLSTILGWGDDGAGVEVSLDRGRTYESFTNTGASGSGGDINDPKTLNATAMDIGAVDGQLEPGDRALLYMRVSIPEDENDPSSAGVYLFNLGLVYDFTE
jgi:hypothetical protein